MINVTIISVLKDNYCYVLQGDDGSCAILDPGDAQPIIDYLEQHNITPDLIINTHHHGDHVSGNADITARYGCKIAAPEAEIDKIGAVDIKLNASSNFEFAGEIVTIVETPGHTLGHICLYFPENKILFSGDTLFSMGCGRLFEGSPKQMWHSLQKLSALPPETKIYCGHEYTMSNAEFCLTIEPENVDLQRRYAEVLELRRENRPTIPVKLETELKTNAFLRAGTAEEFAKIRELKDKA